MPCRPQTGLRRHFSRNHFDTPVLTSFVCLTTLHQRFTCVRLRGPHLTWSWPRLLNWTFTTATLNRRGSTELAEVSSSRFAATPCRPAARGRLSSQAQLRLAHQNCTLWH